MLIIVAVIMWLAERLSHFEESLAQMTKTWSDVAWGRPLDRLQICSGGRSRSVALGYHDYGRAVSRTSARSGGAEFSFLLSTPIIGGAALVQAAPRHEARVAAIADGPSGGRIRDWNCGVGDCRLRDDCVFLRYLQVRTLKVFVAYRILFGIAVLLLGYFGHYAG